LLSKRQRLRWWFIEQRLPTERREAARAERRQEMAEHADDRNERLADRGLAEGERHHSLASDFHKA
jgi:hypothetical protein